MLQRFSYQINKSWYGRRLKKAKFAVKCWLYSFNRLNRLVMQFSNLRIKFIISDHTDSSTTITLPKFLKFFIRLLVKSFCFHDKALGSPPLQNDSSIFQYLIPFNFYIIAAKHLLESFKYSSVFFKLVVIVRF